MPTERVRLDSTTVSGHHAGGEDSLFQFGYSKDDPSLRQVKVMVVGALDPLGLPLVTEVVSGEKADALLYIPAVDRAVDIVTQSVLTYREEWLVERGFHRLKGAPLSLDPLFVKRDDQVVGLTHLLSIAVRWLTLIEFLVRRRLKQQQEKLVGLHAENRKKGTDTPTTERVLKAFGNITLTIVHLPGQVLRHVTPLNALQVRILELLDLSPAIYTRLAEN